MFGKLTKEYEVFKSVPHNMQVLLGTNMLYALVLPIVEIFVGAYIMRNTNSPAYVALYQLAMYVGIVCTSVVNGFLLKHFKVNILYCIGILLSGISMVGMMAIHSLGITELSVAGFVMGAASGFFWTNRYLLALNSTKDDNRNYFFGLDSFAFTIASIIVYNNLWRFSIFYSCFSYYTFFYLRIRRNFEHYVSHNFFYNRT